MLRNNKKTKQSKANKTKPQSWEAFEKAEQQNTLLKLFTILPLKKVKWQVLAICHLEIIGNQQPPWKDPSFQSYVSGSHLKFTWSEGVLTLPCLSCLGWNTLQSLLWNCSSLGGVEDPLQATFGGHALPHSQGSSVGWQGAESSCSTGHGSCCSMSCCSHSSWHCLSSSLPMWNDDTTGGSHWTKCSGTPTDLVPESGTEHRFTGSHCSLLGFLLQNRRPLA